MSGHIRAGGSVSASEVGPPEKEGFRTGKKGKLSRKIAWGNWGGRSYSDHNL